MFKNLRQNIELLRRITPAADDPRAPVMMEVLADIEECLEQLQAQSLAQDEKINDIYQRITTKS